MGQNRPSQNAIIPESARSVCPQQQTSEPDFLFHYYSNPKNTQLDALVSNSQMAPVIGIWGNPDA